MLSCLLACAVLAMRWFPGTPAARWFARATEATIAAAARIERRHLVFVILMTVILVAGTELLAMAGPLDVGLVVMWDVATFVDALLATATLAAVARGRSGWRYVAQRLAPRRAARARRRRSAARAVVKADNDDEGHGGLALAA